MITPDRQLTTANRQPPTIIILYTNIQDIKLQLLISVISGAKTLLLEVHGCLGGVWTSGLLSWILDNQNKMGLMDEIRKRLTAMGAQCPIDTGHVYSFDT
jgi:hypothetical protein